MRPVLSGHPILLHQVKSIPDCMPLCGHTLQKNLYRRRGESWKCTPTVTREQARRLLQTCIDIPEKINSCTVYSGKTPRCINIGQGTGEHLPYDVVVEAAPAPHYTNLAG